MEVYDAPSHYYPSDAMSLDELSYWITFNRVSGIGPVSFKSLLEYFDNDLQAAWQADTKELAQAGLTRNTIENVITLRKTSTPLRELEKLEKLRIRVIIWKDKTYPPLLREIDDSPPVLYTYGRLTEADQFALAVVGTRNSTTYGRQVTERIVTDLAKGQVTIVSGLALGIDTIAHTTALDAGGRTIAVLASGLDIIYPPTNRGLARRIVESGQGALITEYPLGVKPESRDFPACNRIISGLSLGVLITAAPQIQPYTTKNTSCSPEPLHIDELIRESGLPAMTVTSTLTMMEINAQFWFERRLPRNASHPPLCA
ncbi:MAG: DNA-processing protein DprA [Ktedonobacteraceae bacterium]